MPMYTGTSTHMGSTIISYQGRPLAFLAHYVARHRLAHGIVLGSVTLAVIAAVCTQYGLKWLIDVVARGPAVGGQEVWLAFAFLCLLICTDNFMWRVGGWIAAHVFVRVTGDVRSDLFVHLAGHAPGYFSERMPGTLASRITATSNAVFQTENTMSWNTIPPCLAVLVAIVLIATVNPVMAVSLAVVAALMAAVVFRLAARGTPLHRDFATKAAGVDGQLVDVISNMHVVRAFGATWREHARINGTIDTEMTARRRSLLYLEKLRLLHAVMTAFITAGLLAWAVVMWQHGQASAGDVVLICSLGFTILHGTRDLAVALVDVTQHIARLDEAIASLLTPHDLPDAPAARPAQPGPGRVVFDGVRFAYPSRSAVLNELDLVIEPGQRVGLVGASGAGKSTVLALLQRFYDPQGGRILIDGQDLRQITQESLRHAMAVVPQDISLFHRTVMENIRYARPDASEDEVLAAASIARIRDVIEQLPEGFQTMVGDRGVKLSGGQRQRLAIARALLKNAPVLLLDEATSALDSESEYAIQEALNRLMQGRTVIAIAHRLSTLQNFDRIVVMDKGCVIDDGSPEELASRPGPYRDLLGKQSMAPLPLSRAA
ncbi:MAG TPA: ABC transporter ATP-binding protein [Acetobacteraceae bacterium]|nr:ABC transporter ATP-binding protein [Acetobacteraceae bacterium]